MLGGWLPPGSPNLSLTKMLFSTPIFRPGLGRYVRVNIGVNHIMIAQNI